MKNKEDDLYMPLAKFNPTNFNKNSYFFIQITKCKTFLSNIASKEELTPKNMSEIINKRIEDITKTIKDENGTQIIEVLPEFANIFNSLKEIDKSISIYASKIKKLLKRMKAKNSH